MLKSKQFWIYVPIGRLHTKIIKKKWCPFSKTLWGKPHKSGHRQTLTLAWDERGCETFGAYLCEISKHKIYLQKEIWIIQAFANPKWTMGNCFHGLYDPTPKVGRQRPHFLWWWTIFLSWPKWCQVLTRMIMTTFDMAKLLFDMWMKHQRMP